MTHPPSLARILRELVDRHGAHTVLLYGSRADGTAGPDSDWDLVAYAPIASSTRIARPDPDGYIDAWIYPEASLADLPDEEFLRLRGARILLQRGADADRLLASIERLHARGPLPLPEHELTARRVWAHKMADRSERGDAEGDYRRVWLLQQLLDDYFHLRNLWPLGPKKSLAWLAASDPVTHDAFVQALRPNASAGTLRALVSAVAGPGQQDTPPREIGPFGTRE